MTKQSAAFIKSGMSERSPSRRTLAPRDLATMSVSILALHGPSPAISKHAFFRVLRSSQKLSIRVG